MHTIRNMSSPPFVQESGKLVGPALLVHGGAGTFERLRQEGGRARLEEGLAAALGAGWAVFEAGGGALSAAVEAVASLEDSGLFNAGRGSSATSEGRVETDASVMDGATRAAGRRRRGDVAGQPGKGSPAAWRNGRLDDRTRTSRVRPERTNAATAFCWHPCSSPGQVPTSWPRGRPDFDDDNGERRVRRPAGYACPAPAQEHDSPGTVGAVALDGSGHLAAATSTGGLEGKPPGRVGDSAIIGAGTWADDASVAVSATGVGEAFILAGFAHRVDWLTRSGTDLNDALAAALDEVSRHNGSGGAIALVPSGHFVAMWGTRAMARGWRSATEMVVRV